MKYSERKLKSIKRKAQLFDIIEDIEDSGVKIDWNKYPKYKGLKVLSQVILDYQLLVPGEEPDLTELTEVIDKRKAEEEEFSGYIDEMVKTTDKVCDFEYSVPEEEKITTFEPDWNLIATIDVSDGKSYEGRKDIVRAIYLELLGREPDSGGWESYTHHLKDGMSISNLRDAVKHSVEYKRKHKIQ